VWDAAQQEGQTHQHRRCWTQGTRPPPARPQARPRVITASSPFNESRQPATATPRGSRFGRPDPAGSRTRSETLGLRIWRSNAYLALPFVQLPPTLRDHAEDHPTDQDNPDTSPGFGTCRGQRPQRSGGRRQPNRSRLKGGAGREAVGRRQLSTCPQPHYRKRFLQVL